MDQISEFEHNIGNVNVRRRATMLTLTKSKDELVKGLMDNPECFVALFEEVSTYVEHMKGGLALAECAQARLISVGMVLTGEEAA